MRGKMTMAVGETYSELRTAGAASAPADVVLVDSESRIGGEILGALAASGFRLALVTGTAEELLASGVRGETVLLSCEMSRLERPIELITLNEFVDEPIVAVLGDVGPHAVRKALGAGARGVISRATIDRTLVPCLAAVLSGQLCVPGASSGELARPVLSHREKQVLDLASRGLTNSEIGERLFLAESTVKSHLSTGFRKLGVRSRAEAAALVLDPVLAEELGMGAAHHRLIPDGR